VYVYKVVFRVGKAEIGNCDKDGEVDKKAIVLLFTAQLVFDKSGLLLGGGRLQFKEGVVMGLNFGVLLDGHFLFEAVGFILGDDGRQLNVEGLAQLFDI